MNHPDLPPQYSPHSTPMLPNPSPAIKITSAPIIPDFPEDPSESFLEQMCDADPLEGPSWLFASVHKKKRRSSAVRKLSCVWSDSERASTMGSSSGRATTSLDSSDIDISSGGEGASSREVSGYVLDRDLLENAVVVHTPDATLEASTLEPTPGNSVSCLANVTGESATSVTAFEEDMELTRTIEVVENSKQLNSSDQENNPVHLVRPDNIDESILSISVSQTPRTPLSSLTYTDPSGEVVKFNPRTDTGVTVAGLREAHILLSNVGMQTASPYKLSECYIDLSPGRSMSLDQLFSLGLRAGISSPLGKTGKRKHASEATAGLAGLGTPPSKKSRVTDLPTMRQKGVRASLDLIPSDMMAKRTSNINMKKLPSVRVSNVSTVNDAVDSTAKGNEIEIPTQTKTVGDNLGKALQGGNLQDTNRKISVMPSFVLLEKSPVKTIRKTQEMNVVTQDIILGKSTSQPVDVSSTQECSNLDFEFQGMTGEDYQPEIQGNIEIPMESESSTINSGVVMSEASLGNSIEGIVEPEVLPEPEVSAEPDRSRRPKTRVDYAALFQDDDSQKAKRNNKSDKLTTEVPVKKSSKGKLSAKVKIPNSARDKLKETKETRKYSSLEPEKVNDDALVLKDIKKSRSTAPHSKAVRSSKAAYENETAAVVSDDEPETVSSQCLVEQVAVSKPSQFLEKTSRTSNCLVSESGQPNELTQEGNADSIPPESSAGQPESRGRSRRGAAAVSYKEPALGKKLRQGDAGSTSVYSDFNPAGSKGGVGGTKAKKNVKKK